MSRHSLYSLAVLIFAAVACRSDGPAPAIALIGDWSLVGFVDGGVPAVTTGTWTFAADRTFSVKGTVTFPGEPTDSLIVNGAYGQRAGSVELTVGSDAGIWIVAGNGDQITLTEQAPPPPNIITLRRR